MTAKQSMVWLAAAVSLSTVSIYLFSGSLLLAIASSSTVDREIVSEAILVADTQAASFTIDETFVDMAISAAHLSQIIQGNSEPEGFDSFQLFVDGTERAVVAKQNGTCFVAFGAELPSLSERLWLRFSSLWRLDLDKFETACSTTNTCCSLRSIVNRNYRQAIYRSSMESAVRDCVATCPDCPVLLTGHRQGGAVANAAGVYLADLNPVGITFGAPKVFRAGGSCTAIDSSNWFRMVNSVESQYRRSYGKPPGGLIYDFNPLSYDTVPMNSFLHSEHMGHYLVLSLNQNVAYLGLDKQDTFRPVYDEAGTMTTNNANRFNGGYLDHLRFIRDLYSNGLNSYPVPLGFAERDLCSDDNLCASGHCSKQCPLCPHDAQRSIVTKPDILS